MSQKTSWPRRFLIVVSCYHHATHPARSNRGGCYVLGAFQTSMTPSLLSQLQFNLVSEREREKKETLPIDYGPRNVDNVSWALLFTVVILIAAVGAVAGCLPVVDIVNQ
jgi:hypothetical protein